MTFKRSSGDGSISRSVGLGMGMLAAAAVVALFIFGGGDSDLPHSETDEAFRSGLGTAADTPSPNARIPGDLLEDPDIRSSGQASDDMRLLSRRLREVIAPPANQDAGSGSPEASASHKGE